MRISLKRVGAMWHWRVSRIGGSLYIAKAKPAPKRILVVTQPVRSPRDLSLTLARLQGSK